MAFRIWQNFSMTGRGFGGILLGDQGATAFVMRGPGCADGGRPQSLRDPYLPVEWRTVGGLQELPIGLIH